MAQHPYMLLFFTGMVPLVLSVPCKYHLIQQGKRWSDAQVYCQATHTDLAIIESNDNKVQLQIEAQEKQFNSSAWLGLYNDVDSWRWSFRNELLGSMRPWASGEPDNWHGHEECALISKGGWSDGKCTDTKPFICFDDTKTGNQMYIYISTTMTWYKAQAYCRTFHTDLASSNNATENSVIAGLTNDWTWFGLFRDSWKWIDQTNFSTITWMSNKPDNALKNENCGYINNSKAADAQCSDIMPFFCYSVITGKQQIMRMKVWSFQDVNNPAAKVAILEQIKQKLKDHGMTENIMLKWREQPDGKVFDKKKANNSTEKEEI